MNNLDITDKKIKEGFVGQRMIILPPNIKKIVTKNDLVKHCYLTNIGYYPHASYHDRERVAGCGQYILLYCIEGTGTVKVNEDTFKISPNMFMILPKYEYHHYASSKHEPWSIYWVHFAGDQADLLFSRYATISHGPIATPYDEKRINEFDEILNLLESGFEEQHLEIVNLKLIYFLSSLVYSKALNPSMHDDDAVQNSVDYMKANLGTRKTVVDFARQQHLSASHFTRIFKNKTGSTPNNYFNQLKVQKSCQYLYFSDRNIKEICVELGFDDPFYFSRLFKKLMGMSPAHYKNQYKKDNYKAVTPVDEL